MSKSCNGTKNTQGGFGAIVICISIVVVLILAVAGYVVFRNAESSNNTAATTPPVAMPATNQPASQPEAMPAQPATTPFTVAELGIKFDIPPSLQNQELRYLIRDIQLSDGSTAKAAYFSTRQLESIDDRCAAKNMSIAAMTVGQGAYPKDSPTVAIDYGPLLKQFSEKFVTFLTSRASCTEGKGATYEKQLSDTQSDLVVSVKSVELVK